MKLVQHQQIKNFVNEMSDFAKIAEETLEAIEKDKEGNKGLFTVFSDRMLTIRGTALQLELPDIARIAGLGEEIANRGSRSDSRAQIRKCLGALWDALTTVKFLLEEHLRPAIAAPNKQDEQNEQAILINRLEKTLASFGGKRESVSNDEIEKLLRERDNS